jgi:hypothetical protein
MKFKTQTTELAKALSTASVVHPSPIDSQGSSGFLFVVRGERCYIYSDDGHQKSRVEFPIFDVEGEGAFVYPAGPTAFQYLDGWVELEPGEEKGAFLVKYRTEGGASSTMPTFDPRALQSLDKDLESASEGPTFPAVLLKDAIAMGKSYLADGDGARVPEAFKSFQLFDKSKPAWEAGNGHFFAANGYRAFYFYSPVFEDKNLSLHSLRTGLATSFLSKVKGDIRIRQSERSTYFISDNYVVGWSDPVVEHEKFSYYPHTVDTHVLRVQKEICLKALHHVRAELNSKKDKVRIQYNAEKTTLQFLASDNGKEIYSVPFGVDPKGPEDSTESTPIRGGAKSKTESFAFNLNIDHFMDLIAPLKEHAVELRIGAQKADSYLIRTIETFEMDAAGKAVLPVEGETTYTCRVTRFMSNMK